MKSALSRSFWQVSFSLALLFGVASSLRAGSPPSAVPSETALLTSSCANELSSREPSQVSSAPLASAQAQASLWPPPNSCGEICQSTCESFCGIGLGRCNPMSMCACECW